MAACFHRCGVLFVARAVRIAALALTLCASFAFAAEPAAPADDPVMLRFATVGDSRADPATPGLTVQDRRWLQNSPVLARLLKEIGAQQPQLLFFNGDMIMGYEPLQPDVPAVRLDGQDGVPVEWSAYAHLAMEYAYWRGMVAGLLEGGVYVVPVPGNHEMQNRPAAEAGDKSVPRIARAANEQLWRASMGDLILDQERLRRSPAGPPAWFSGDDPRPELAEPAVADHLPSSQRQLSYSFDIAHQHFVVLDTDPVGHDGEVAVNWLAADLDAAEQRQVEHVFVFGHKPAFTYHFADAMDEHGLSDLAPGGNRDRFWALIERHHASYFCGHQHIYHLEQPTASTGGASWQVMVGSGGSPFSAAHPAVKGPTAHPATDLSYAWAVVDIHRSGRVELHSHGFDRDLGPTRVLDQVTLPGRQGAQGTPAS